jgi:hypothetical protein
MKKSLDDLSRKYHVNSGAHAGRTVSTTSETGRDTLCASQVPPDKLPILAWLTSSNAGWNGRFGMRQGFPQAPGGVRTDACDQFKPKSER